MSWAQQLVDGVKDAFGRDTACKIAVHSEAQIELGQRAIQRLDAGKARNLTFVLIPAEERDQYPVGTLVP